MTASAPNKRHWTSLAAGSLSPTSYRLKYHNQNRPGISDANTAPTNPPLRFHHLDHNPTPKAFHRYPNKLPAPPGTPHSGTSQRRPPAHRGLPVPWVGCKTDIWA